MTITFRNDMRVELVQSMGGDASVIAAARVSSSGSASVSELQKDPKGGAKLIHQLMEHRHGTPFEHNSMTFLIEAPIFVFREWHRHRIGWSYNEFSARYRKKMKDDFWVTAETRPLVKDGASMSPKFIEPGGERWKKLKGELEVAYADAWKHYEAILAEGTAPEIARAVLPVGTYSSMYATCNARSMMAFLELRTHEPRAHNPSFPQLEIEECARKLESEFAKKFPLTYEAFVKFGRVAP